MAARRRRPDFTALHTYIRVGCTGNPGGCMEEDYSKRIESYSLEDLRGVLLSIDKETHPDRYALASERLRKLEGNEAWPVESGTGPSAPGTRPAAMQTVDLEFNERNTGLLNTGFYPIGILFCVYRLHAYLGEITDGAYPIKPAAAAFKHLIPFYGVYWPKKWAQEVFIVLKTKEGETKTLTKYGVMIGTAEVITRLDTGIGLILIFIGLTKISGVIVKEYEARNLCMLKAASQEIGRKLLLE
jgi:hypothetical protein